MLCAEEFCRAPDRLELFPYPKAKKKLRQLSLLTLRDLALLRFVAGILIERVDAVLPAAVYLYRLAQIKPIWEFKNRAWRDFTRDGIKIIKSRQYAGMYRTDVSSYYPSISLDVLQETLEQIGCDRDCINFVISILAFYNNQIVGLGLPIGPEACAVLSNAYLSPLDSRLSQLGARYLRYGDDVLLFAEKVTEYERLLREIDEQFSELRLIRSIEKSNFYDPDAAIENLKSGRIDYLGHLLNVEPEYGLRNVRRDFDAEVIGDADPDPSKFRWLLKVLQNKGDDHACSALAASPEKMNIDPRVTSDYFIETGFSDSRVIEAMMERLTAGTEDQYEGLDLHLLRAVSTQAFGGPESKEFKKIAMDSSRRYPIRNWAWKAYAKSSGKYPELAEAASAETNPRVRRGIIVSMLGCTDGKFLDHVRRKFPESRYAAEWLAAA